MGTKVSIRLVGLVVLVAALTSGTANATTGRGIQADGLRWQGIARVYAQMESLPAASLPSTQALKADAQRWQGMALTYQRQQSSAAAASESAGFNWADAGIGAAAIFALMLLLAAMARLIQHRQVVQPQGPEQIVA